VSEHDPGPVDELAELRRRYDALEREMDALRADATGTARELLAVIDQQRGLFDQALAASSARYAIRASNIGRLLGTATGLRRQVREWRMRAGATAARRERRRRVLHVPEAVRQAPIGVNVSGYITAESGLGEATRCSLRALQLAQVPFVLNNVRGPQRTADTSFTDFTTDHPHPFNLVHLNADNMDAFAHERGPGYFAGRYTIGYWFWELEEFRADFRRGFGRVDEVWVASEHTRRSIGHEAPVPVVHVPLGLPEPVIGPFGRAHFGLPDGPFIFLYTFDVSSQMERKNPLAAIRAFRLAALGHDDAVLLLKFTNGHTDRAAVRRLAEAASGLNVVMLDVAMHRPEINALMHVSDACLSLHRAEGFGMTIAEHMAMGKPAIASAYSGNMDFMTPEVSRLVDVTRIQIAGDYGPYLRGMTWGDPDVEQAGRFIQELALAPDRARDLGARGAAHVRAVLNPGRTAALMRSRLRQIQATHLQVSGIVPPPEMEAPEYK
jgi:glycosyltransferase involved in cell wall biosynthesis